MSLSCVQTQQGVWRGTNKKKKPGMRRCPVPVPGAGVEGKGKEEVKTECPMSQDKWDRSQWWWHRTGGWPRSHNDGEITDLWLNSGGGSLGEVEQIIYSWELWQVPAIPTRGSRRAFTYFIWKTEEKKKRSVFPNLKCKLVLCSWGRHLKASGKKWGQLPPGPLSMKSVYCDLDSRADTAPL